MARAVLVCPRARKHDALLKRIGLKRGDLVIGVDGGAERLLQSGIRPTICVGDWDSTSAAAKRRILSQERHLTLAKEKDRSDLHYAFQVARHFGAQEIVALGFSGGRADHQLGVLFEFAEVAGQKSAPQSLSYLSESEVVHFISPHTRPVRLALKRGAVASVFSLLGEAGGVRLEGFRFTISGGRLAPSSHGLSNLTTAGRQRVSVKKGVLALVIPLRS